MIYLTSAGPRARARARASRSTAPKRMAHDPKEARRAPVNGKPANDTSPPKEPSAPTNGVFDLRSLDLREQIPFDQRREQLRREVQQDTTKAHLLHRQQLQQAAERETFEHRAAEADATLKLIKALRAMRDLRDASTERDIAREHAERRLAIEERREQRLWWTAVGTAVAGVIGAAYLASKDDR